jgi:LPPG:FO 2-phospho-L-lactate transferase
VAPERITVIGNTGDDLELHGLHISPDLDTVAYTLAGLADPERGWGHHGETFECLRWLGRYGGETWFQLGDRDLATHIHRTGLLRRGVPLSEATRQICHALGVRPRLLPATDSRLRTRVDTPEGRLDFQVYFVQRRTEPEVTGVVFDGAETSHPAPGVLEAIAAAAAVIVCPSNPLISIGPILAVPGIREALRATAAPIAAVSPIVGGKALKGPADRMMRGMGLEPSAVAVGRLYRDFLDVLVMDEADRACVPAVEALGLRAVVTDTVMRDAATRRALAAATLQAVGL